MTITDKTIDHLRLSLAFWRTDLAAGIYPKELSVSAVNALPGLLDDRKRDRERIAELEAALREIEPAALYHPQQVWPDELKAIIRTIVGIARKALNKGSAT